MQPYTPTEVSSDASTPDLPSDRNLTVADTGSGLLVFAATDDGRELIAFSDVQDWDAIHGALQKRGLDVGATYHLPVIDVEDISIAKNDT